MHFLGRPILILFAVVWFTVASIPHAARAASHDPPAGIRPTTATLQDILARHSTAVGTPSNSIRSRVETDSISAFGSTGTAQYVRVGSDFRLSETLGPLSDAEGARNGRHWVQTENGLTIIMQGVHGSEQYIDRSPDDSLKNPSNHAKLLGELGSPEDAYVIELKPNGGSPWYVFVDAKTFLIDRQEFGSGTDRSAVTYSDERTTNGLTEPWHGHLDAPYKGNDLDWQVTSLRYGGEVPATDLDIPPDRRHLLEFPAGKATTLIPVRILDGAIVVRVQIAGRGVDLQVDSGASGIFLDRGLVDALHLQTFGDSTPDKSGRYAPAHAVLPDMQIGDLHMRNLIVNSLPWYYEPSDDTQVEGLIGYDFLASGFVKLDYLNQTLTVSDWNDVALPAGQSFIVPAALDDRVPTAGARVGSDVGDHFVVDTGDSFGIFIFRRFADAHPEDVSDSGAGKQLRYVLPFVSALGVGGEINVTPTQVRAFHFGGVGFDNFVLFVADRSDAFGMSDDDGLVGWGFLEFFDVYFDYHNYRIVLQPNKLLLRVTKQI